MFESPIPEEKYSPPEISVRDRNLLHIEIMKLMLPELTDDTELEWMKENGGRISEIIDNVDNGDVRDLITGGNIFEASHLIKTILEKENSDIEMKQAA
ncbi:MAG: hypothetical protein WC229_01705 [Candidatus Paceibacterota bacterium]|jgi:hypothetical protein